MKRGGFSLIEVMVSILLFFISLIPLVKYTLDSFKYGRRYVEIEEEYRNFRALDRQLRDKNTQLLLENLGSREYHQKNFGHDSLTSEIFLPYELEREFNLILDITKEKIYFDSKGYEYIKLKIMYMNKNKKISSEKYIDIGRRRYD